MKSLTNVSRRDPSRGRPTIPLAFAAGLGLAVVLVMSLALPAAADDDWDVRTFVPGVVSASGFHGSAWTSSLALLNPDADLALPVRLEFLPSTEGIDSISKVVIIAPAQSLRWDDVLANAIGATTPSWGTLRISVPSALVSPIVSAQVSTSRPGGGRFGEALPVFAARDFRQSALFASLREDETWRSNLGLLNPTASEINVHVIVDAEGQDPPRREFDVPVASGATVQVNGFAWQAGFAIPAKFTTRISASGPFQAWVSLIDNRTNDPAIIVLDDAPSDTPPTWDGFASAPGALGTI